MPLTQNLLRETIFVFFLRKKYNSKTILYMEHK